MIERQPLPIDPELRSQLLILKENAADLGASDARIIPTHFISIEDRVVEMCKAPLCEGYGKSANCPPHAMSPGDARAWIGQYSWALFFKIDVSPEVLLGEHRFDVFRRVYLIVSDLETLSLRLGFSGSRGLAAGSCLPVFCKGTDCSVLVNGGECRFPSLARPSMEALGINVFKLAGDVGWNIHTILKDSDPERIPAAMLAGLLLVV